MTELLAPVGSSEALTAAVESGADAVYLAGKLFGARAYAPNFTDEELAEAITYAHLRGVHVYVAVNTLVDNGEIVQLIEYLRFLYRAGADAIIVQDLGVAWIARQVTPGLPLHASTQMTVHNLAGVEFLTQLGFTRVVLARELSLDDIGHICRHTKTEIEVFVHGALCISYSGQCLMSGMIGGRSGNRGRCAQPCRLPYTLVDEHGNDMLSNIDTGEFLLSPKDLNTLELIPELVAAGVTSFKIEGRMKRPEYVAVVVDSYRRAVDACLAGSSQSEHTVMADQKAVAQIFNRDFTTAYLTRTPGKTMMSDRRPNNRGVRIGRVAAWHPANRQATIKLEEELHIDDIIEFWVKVGGRVSATVTAMSIDGRSVTTAAAGALVTIAIPGVVRENDRVFKVFDAKLMERARTFFNGRTSMRRIGVEVCVTVAEGQPLTIEMQDEVGNTSCAQTVFIAERALKRPLTHETIEKQIERLGTTVFELRSLTCSIAGEVMVPVSEINDARRRAVEQLEQERLKLFVRPDLKTTIGSCLQQQFESGGARTESKNNMPLLAVHVDDIGKIEAALKNGADVIMFGGENFDHNIIDNRQYGNAVAMVRRYRRKIVLSTPRLVKQCQTKALVDQLALFDTLKPDGISVSNAGSLLLARASTTLPLHGDYPLNIYNNATMCLLDQYGISSVTLSPELNFSQIDRIAASSNMALECIVHGYLTLMISEHCLIGSQLGGLHTGKCAGTCQQRRFWLKDRKEELFPVVTDQYCRMHILNGKELDLLDHVDKFARMGIAQIRIEGKYGSPAALGKITAQYRQALDGSNQQLDLPDQARGNQGMTRGHYFRGVL